tara:strand:- start:246 stop:527 length:282 start_codon:yes stop_codon:yes gene_type:complete
MMAEKKLGEFIKTLIDFLEDASDEYNADSIEIFASALAVCVAGLRKVAVSAKDDAEMAESLMKLGIVWDPTGDEIFELSDLNPNSPPEDETIH